MCGEVDTYQLFLPVQSLQDAPVFTGWDLRLGDRHKFIRSEKGVGRRELVRLIFIAVADQRVEELFALAILRIELLALDAEVIEGTRQSQ